MLKHAHAAFGMFAILQILVYQIATILSEVFGTAPQIQTVKTAILWSLPILVAALIGAGMSGRALTKPSNANWSMRKQRRMKFAALTGTLILIPCAIFLQSRAAQGQFDLVFYGVQMLELAAGLFNLSLLMQNAQQGMRWRKSHA